MAITDNLIYRLKPAAGHTTPHNEVGAGEVLSGGTIALVDTGANGYAWRFTGAQSALTLPSKNLAVSVDGGGVTLAIRIRRAALPTVLGQHMVGWDNGAATAGLFVKTGSSDSTDIFFRATVSVNIQASKLAVATSVTQTYVMRLHAGAANLADRVQLWWEQVGRTGTASDAASALDNGTAQNVTRVFVNPANSGDFYIHELVLWGRELTDAECAAVADGINAALAVDTTAPTLTSPTGTKTGSTTASGTVSTDEANGTLYRLASINATETAATVKAAALTTTVSATGSQSVTFTGLAPTTTYYAHYVHTDPANNDSALVSSASFTTDAAPATATTLSGPSGGQVGVASAPFTVGANGAITGTITVTPSDGGGGGAFSPTSVNISAGIPTGTFTYTPGSAGAKTISIADTGGLTDAAAVTYTASLAAGTFTSAVLKNNTGTVLASKALTYFRLYDPATGNLVVSKAGLSTNGSGVVSFSDGAVAAGTTYKCDWLTSEGHYRMPSAEAT